MKKVKVAERVPSGKKIMNEGAGVYIAAPKTPGFYSLSLLVNEGGHTIGWQWNREAPAELGIPTSARK